MKLIQEKLRQAAKYRLRKRQALKAGFIDFLSNDYLGLAASSANFSSEHGSASSRLISGQHPPLTAIEKKMAHFFDFPEALFFPSGYHANLAIVSAFAHRSTCFFYDELIHASIHDAMRMGQAKSVAFKHNDLSHLNSLLVQNPGENRIIISEGLFSMDGDCAPVEQLLDLAQKHQAYLLLDEAHSAGILGPSNKGLINHHPHLLAKVVTFGKAFGCEGGAILCSSDCANFLVNFSRPLIYSTAPSPVLCEALNHQLDAFSNTQADQQKLWSICRYFKTLMAPWINNDDITGPIFPILLPDADLKQIERACYDAQIGVKAIYHPTVARGQERLRICLHSYNTVEDVDSLFKIMRTHIKQNRNEAI